MKVHIKKYPNWIGPYQIAGLLKYFNVSSEKIDDIGEYLSKTKLNNLCEWIYHKKQPKHKIQIEYFDTWANSGLGMVICEWLKEFKKRLYGAPFIDNDDVPDDLKTIDETDENWFKKWDYILDEMIFAFDYSINKSSEDSIHSDNYKRMQNGLRLFAKYYHNLWN